MAVISVWTVRVYAEVIRREEDAFFQVEPCLSSVSARFCCGGALLSGRWNRIVRVRDPLPCVLSDWSVELDSGSA